MMNRLAKQLFGKLCILVVACSITRPVHAQDAKPPSLSRDETASPQLLRDRKSQIESELAEAREELAKKKRELEEIRLIELTVDRPSAPRPLDTSVIEQIARTADALRRELRERATFALSDRTFTPLDPDKYQTFAARELSLRLQSVARVPADVPSDCEYTGPPIDPSKAVEACVNAVKKILEDRARNPPTGPREEIAKAKGAVSAEIEALNENIKTSETLLRQVGSLLETSNDLTQIIIKWTVPSLGLVLVLLLIAPRLYGATLQSEIFNQKLTLDLLTVYILVSTILILGLANRLQNEVLGTLLGGISGYVLGRSAAYRQSGEKDRPTPTPTPTSPPAAATDAPPPD